MDMTRWRRLPGMPVLICIALLVAAGSSGADTSVDSIGITVSDMDRSLAFYTGVLTFEPVSDTEVHGEDYERLLGVFGLRLRVVRLRLGDEYIELMQYLAPRGRPIPADSRSNDEWFQHIAIVVADMDRAYARLRRAGVQHASSGPQTLPAWNPNAGGISAFYFRDPDDNHLEIIHFPADKGDPRWQQPSPRLFLGIDHTAIVVDDTDDSLRYYRDMFDLRVAGEAENFGPEQERLNNVFGARLRITALKSDAGPGVELLEYLAPASGRPMPADTQANDLWHWQINIASDAFGDLSGALAAARYPLVTGGAAVPGHLPAFGRALLVRDPDGHAAMLFEPGAPVFAARGRGNHTRDNRNVTGASQ